MNSTRKLELLPNVHILIYSNTADAQQFARMLTEKANISPDLRPATGAQEVEAALRERDWDLIIWDCALSVLPTAAAIQRIQILQPETPIMLLADDPSVQETVDLMLMGARGVVTRENSHRFVDLVWQELAPQLQVPADIDGHVGPIYATEQELRRARARAETSEQILRETQKVAEVGYWELDLVHNSLHWSEDVYAIIGCPLEGFEATYEAFLEFVHPDDRQWVDAAYNHHLTTKQPYNIVHRVITRDGQLKYVRERCQTTFDEVGVPLRSLGVIADVTQIKLAEEALQESKAHQNAIIKAIPDLMFCIKTDGTFVDYHAPSDDHLALPPEMFIGRKAQDILPPEIAQKQMAAMERVMATQQPTQYEYSLNIQGQEREYEARLVPVSGDEMLAIVRDVTEQRRLGAALRAHFAMMASYDLRTPLATIHASSEILRGYAENLSPEQKERQLDRIDGAVQEVADLLDDMLAFTEIENAYQIFALQPLDILAFTQSVVDELWQTDRDAHRIAIHNSLPGPVAADARLLRQILTNLLTNAIKYSPPGTEITISLYPQDGYTCLRVQDQGIGIPAESLPHIFAPFHRGANTGQVKGTGLGLTIVKRCVELHQGTIEVDSQIGHGTTCTVCLPSV